jgi:hypothetical protein
MKILRFICITIAIGSTVAASAATVNKTGVPTVKHPMGIQLRQESVRSHGGFYHGGIRTHHGGGIRSHK